MQRARLPSPLFFYSSRGARVRPCRGGRPAPEGLVEAWAQVATLQQEVTQLREENGALREENASIAALREEVAILRSSLEALKADQQPPDTAA